MHHPLGHQWTLTTVLIKLDLHWQSQTGWSMCFGSQKLYHAHAWDCAPRERRSRWPAASGATLHLGTFAEEHDLAEAKSKGQQTQNNMHLSPSLYIICASVWSPAKLV